MVERGAGRRGEMRVIAALDRHRDPIAERRGHDIRPRAEADDRLARQQRPLLRLDAIAGAGRAERFRVAAQENAAALLEQSAIAQRQRQRVGQRGRVEIMHGAVDAASEGSIVAQGGGIVKRDLEADRARSVSPPRGPPQRSPRCGTASASRSCAAVRARRPAPSAFHVRSGSSRSAGEPPWRGERPGPARIRANSAAAKARKRADRANDSAPRWRR